MVIEQRFALEYREIRTDHPGLVMYDDGTVWLVQADSSRIQIGTFSLQIPEDRSMTFTDDEGNPIFQVREDGTVHIRFGQTLVADL